MDIVPVLDIRGGIVVHARRGERASYAPLESALIGGCEAVSVLRAMLDAVAAADRAAPSAYVADLDAIVHGRPQWDLLETLRRSAPVPLWLDAGFATCDAAVAAAQRGFVPVVGSESLACSDSLRELGATLGPDGWLLSLDCDGHGPRDPAGLMTRPALWPRRVIAMDLTRVGSAAGGVGKWLQQCMRVGPDRTWVAAGGVRGRDDLEALVAAGASAVLVASALHSAGAALAARPHA